MCKPFNGFPVHLEQKPPSLAWTSKLPSDYDPDPTSVYTSLPSAPGGYHWAAFQLPTLKALSLEAIAYVNLHVMTFPSLITLLLQVSGLIFSGITLRIDYEPFIQSVFQYNPGSLIISYCLYSYIVLKLVNICSLPEDRPTCLVHFFSWLMVVTILWKRAINSYSEHCYPVEDIKA